MNKLFTKIKEMLSMNRNPIEEQEPEPYYIMTDEEFVQFHNDRLAELDPEIVEKAVKVLSEHFSTETLEETRQLYKEDPIHWMSPYHFYEGMFIRNLLRDKACLDDKLPSGNFDDYYVQLMEIAAGCREYPRKKEEE